MKDFEQRFGPSSDPRQRKLKLRHLKVKAQHPPRPHSVASERLVQQPYVAPRPRAPVFDVTSLSVLLTLLPSMPENVDSIVFAKLGFERWPTSSRVGVKSARWLDLVFLQRMFAQVSASITQRRLTG